MIDHFRENLVAHWRETVGFALFLAWVYCALFGCGLSSAVYPRRVPTTYHLERIWLMCGLFEALGGVAGMLIARKVPAADRLLQSDRLLTAAATIAAAGNFFIWLAGRPHAAVRRGVRSRKRPERHRHRAVHRHLERALRASTKRASNSSSPARSPSRFCCTSSSCSRRRAASSCCCSWPPCASGPCTSHAAMKPPPPDAAAEGRAAGRRGLRSFTLLAFASWVQIAFFRVLSTPALSGNRFTHYLIPFSFACVMSLAMLLLCMRMSRYMNVSLAYRWSLPLFMLSYVPIILDYGNANLRILAYAINFLGMFGVQFGCWIGACKYLRRRGGSTVDLFSRYALGEGAGIFAGSLGGLFAVKLLDAQGIMVLSFALMSLVVFVAMATGFNPNWVFHRTHPPRRRANAGPGADATPRAELEAIFLREAVALQGRFGLTERETDVAALLLAGRSRPFIRDELTVSINTVSSHVRSIFSKCGVHSQQELIDLARNDEGEQGGAQGAPA